MNTESHKKNTYFKGESLLTGLTENLLMRSSDLAEDIVSLRLKLYGGPRVHHSTARAALRQYCMIDTWLSSWQKFCHDVCSSYTSLYPLLIL